MATNLLWFVMAGFLLGFATSTLWEWFYFRKERLKLTDRRIRELEAKLRNPETATDTLSPTGTIPTIASVTGASRTSAWGDTAYRSPGVFLESEEYKADGDEPAALGRERPRPPLSNIPPRGPSSPAAIPSVSSVTPVTPTPITATPSSMSSATVSSPTVNSSESTLVQRSEQTPADALRAKRGDSPRSRQEVLAALRRNSEAAQRGQFARTEGEAAPAETTRPELPRESTLVTPTPPASEVSPAYEEPPTFISSIPATPATEASAPESTAPEIATPTPVVSPARQRWIDHPDLTQRTQEYPDDLSKIKGIGDVYKQRLYQAGIYTWKQIAEGDHETLRRATSAYPSSNVEEWLVQAQKLMEKHGRTNAVYSGPPPDEMTKILGIGPVGAAVLYRAGICTYEQLASTSIADLEALFPIAVAGDQPDFAQWVARATALADEKHRD